MRDFGGCKLSVGGGREGAGNPGGWDRGGKLLKAILPLFPLDTYEEDRFIMEVVPGDPEPAIWEEYAEILKELEPDTEIKFLERFAYYERAEQGVLHRRDGREGTVWEYHFEKGRYIALFCVQF